MFQNCFVFVIKFKKVHKKVNIVCFFIFLCYIKNMNKKIVKFSKIMAIVVLSIMLVMSVCALIFIVLGNFLSQFKSLNYAYGLVGEILMPIEFIFKGELGALGDNFAAIAIGIVLATIVLYAFCIKDVLCAYRKNYTIKKFNRISALILTAIIFAYFALNLIIICINFKAFGTYLKFKITALQDISKGLGFSFVLLKSIIICSVVMFVSLFTFLAYLFNKQKETKHAKVLGSLTFYSDEFVEKTSKENEIVQTAQLENKKEQPVKTKTKKESKELVDKIMQLNALKDQGKISAVEYTKLRQRAIRKYKG